MTPPAGATALRNTRRFYQLFISKLLNAVSEVTELSINVLGEEVNAIFFFFGQYSIYYNHEEL